MKKKNVKKSAVVKTCKSWLWILVAFVIGGAIGYGTHYTIINWDFYFGEPLKCEDGSRPDKNGCCAGEVYTDAGGGWMVCCPDGGNNCFPPIKKM